MAGRKGWRNFSREFKAKVARNAMRRVMMVSPVGSKCRWRVWR